MITNPGEAVAFWNRGRVTVAHDPKRTFSPFRAVERLARRPDTIWCDSRRQGEICMRKSLDDYTKEDWILANTHGSIKQDTAIYRVFRVDYLSSDLAKDAITLVNPCYETQDDDLENPLKGAWFGIDGTKHQLFSSLMSEYYSQSWSLEKPSWGYFGEGNDTVRIQSTVGKVFAQLMDSSDPFYSLYYHVGLIEYEDAQLIQDNVKQSNFSEFLDSQGYGLLKTVMKIRANYAKEREVRFVYIRSPRPSYDVPLKHKVFGNQAQYCSHAFDWRNIIDAYEFDPNNRSRHPTLIATIESVRY